MAFIDQGNTATETNTVYLMYRLGTKGEKVLACATTSKVLLKKAVTSLLHDGSVRYRDSDGSVIASPVDSIRQFRKDWKEMSRLELNERLVGALLSLTNNGALI